MARLVRSRTRRTYANDVAVLSRFRTAVTLDAAVDPVLRKKAVAQADALTGTIAQLVAALPQEDEEEPAAE